MFTVQVDMACQDPTCPELVEGDHLYNFRVERDMLPRVCGSYDRETVTGFENDVIKLDEF